MTRTYQYTNKKTKKVAEGMELQNILDRVNYAYDKCNAAENNLKAYVRIVDGIGEMGLIKKEVRNGAEYKKLESVFKVTFKKLQDTNKKIYKEYKICTIYN